MGSLWGATSPITQHAATIYADILMNAGASIPIEAEADERAVVVALGDATLDGEALERYSLYILKPGEAMTLRAASDARVMLLRSEEHTYELQSLLRTQYAVFCLKTKTIQHTSLPT